MPRTLKTFTQLEPQRAELAQPKSNFFNLDLAGLDLSEAQLAQVRQAAVRAAMTAAADLLGRAGRPANVMDGFATFSTFSTFSTFGSGAAVIRPGELNLAPEALRVIDRVSPGAAR
jgi:hypothetical protein